MTYISAAYTEVSDAYTEVAMDTDIHMATKTIHKSREQGRFSSRLKMRRYSKTKQKFQKKQKDV